jgi:hypothetical protein
VDFQGAPQAPERCETRILPVDRLSLGLVWWFCVGQMDCDYLHA